MSDKTERHPIAQKTVRYAASGSDAVTVRADVPYKGDDPALTLDVYIPPGIGGGAPPPAVVIVSGYRDVGVTLRLGCQFKEMGMSASWARLVAASGMAAITYTTRDPAADVGTVIQYIRQHAASLGVEDRIGLFAASANVVVALSALMGDDADLTCAALLYGFTLDGDGSTVVADAAQTYGFVNACAGRSVDDLANTPLCIVRAGQDQFPGLNQGLDRFVSQALRRNLPVTVVNYATGAHGFDLDDDSDSSRDVVRQVIAFLRFQLLRS